ncbi:hypothetical protein ACFV80_39610 [Streptomyces sp. NPDC059862]
MLDFSFDYAAGAAQASFPRDLVQLQADSYRACTEENCTRWL